PGCGKRATGCFARALAPASSSNGWRRAYRYPRPATATAGPSRIGATADTAAPSIKKGRPKAPFSASPGCLPVLLVDADPDILRDAVPVQQQQRGLVVRIRDALQLLRGLVRGLHRLLVDRLHHVAAAQAQIVGKAAA